MLVRGHANQSLFCKEKPLLGDSYYLQFYFTLFFPSEFKNDVQVKKSLLKIWKSAMKERVFDTGLFKV